MHLAVDAGNSNIVLGLHDGKDWVKVLRIKTDSASTEDELASLFFGMCRASSLDPSAIEKVSIASVVPALDFTLTQFSSKWLKATPYFLTHQSDLGFQNLYEPPSGVGADRLANALAALQFGKAPIVIVDFGTATTFDAIDKEGDYLGGAILPGPMVAANALIGKAAKLPQFPMTEPKHSIGRNTPEAMQSGLVLGYADAIDGLALRISNELGGATIICTGGLAPLFQHVCKHLGNFHPNLTLDGIILARNLVDNHSN